MAVSIQEIASNVLELNPGQSQGEATNPEGDGEDILGNEDEAQAKSDTESKRRRYTTLELIEGYGTPVAFVFYVADEAAAKGYGLPALSEVIKRHVSKFEGAPLAVTITDSHVNEKGPDGKRIKGELLASRLYIDTPESKARAEERGRKAPRAAKPAEQKDLPKIMRSIQSMQLDAEFLAEAKAAGRDPLELARERACSKHNVSLETLRDWYMSMFGMSA